MLYGYISKLFFQPKFNFMKLCRYFEDFYSWYTSMNGFKKRFSEILIADDNYWETFSWILSSLRIPDSY